MAKTKLICPYCPKKFDDTAEQSRHVAQHVVEIIRKDHPGLLEMISTVESEMPVKFLLKVDTDALITSTAAANKLVAEMDAEGIAGGGG